MIIEPFAVTLTSNGAQSLLPNLISGVPDGIVFMNGGKYGVNETSNARGSMGMASNDGTGSVYYQFGTGHLKNTVGPFTRGWPGADASGILDGSSGIPTNLVNVTGFSAGQVDIVASNVDNTFQLTGFVYQL